MTKLEVVGFGALNIDKIYKVSRISGEDEESSIIDHRVSCGGSAANTIVGLARLGVETGFIGKVSSDPEGQMLIDEFRNDRVDTQGIVKTKTGRTGIVMVFVDPEGERALYVDSGVNDTIDPKELSLKYLTDIRLLHITSFVGESSFKSQIELLRQLPSHVKVSLDPGMLYAKRGLQSLKPLLERVSIMLPSEAELGLLSGKAYQAGANELLSRGIEVIGVKLGRRGCFVTDGKREFHIKAPKAKVTDTTGAGDAWNAGFLYGLLKDRKLEECGRLGNTVASKCIAELGARAGLPTLSDLT